MKFSDDLTEQDFRDYPIWRETSLEPEAQGWRMRPVKKRPIEDLHRCWIGSECILANGDKNYMAIRFLHNKNSLKNKHVATLIAFTPAGQLHLCRYYGPEVKERGAEVFAAALGLRPSDVFPLKYDVTPLVVGNSDALRGQIEEPPSSPLTQQEVYDLIIEDEASRFGLPKAGLGDALPREGSKQ